MSTAISWISLRDGRTSTADLYWLGTNWVDCFPGWATGSVDAIPEPKQWSVTMLAATGTDDRCLHAY